LVNVPQMKFPADIDWRCWIERWDRVQDRYVTHREERFELDAYDRALKIDVEGFRTELMGPWEGSEEGLPLEWHFERLRASGFEAVDCFWRCDCDAIYGGLRHST